MRRFLKAVGMLFAASLAMILLVLAAAYSTGTVWISVNERTPQRHRIVVAVPAVVIPLALRLMPEEQLGEITRQVGPWVGAIQSAAGVLEHCPDATLVTVKEPAQSVRISKRGGSLLIDTDSEQAEVHVSFPVELVAAVARGLAARLPAQSAI